MPKQLRKEQIVLIKASIPVLAENGLAITKQFYSDLFSVHPELLNLFNHANQKNNKQQQALANTLYAAASQIENLESLLPVVRQIAHKHRSLQVKPEHYPIVGEHLIGAMRTVLGKEATDEMLEAWTDAYGMIAEMFISVETEMYREANVHGWEGFRCFILERKEQETDTVASFYLVPEDGKPLQLFEPGQYVTVKGYNHTDSYTHLRQYSLSDEPNQEYYRLSIKREEAGGVEGTVSSYMHRLQEGDCVELTAPAGEFTSGSTNGELVLMSAGIGITPLASMAKSSLAKHPKRSVVFIHVAPDRHSHALRAEIEELADAYPSLRYRPYYTNAGSAEMTPKDWVTSDRNQQFYICGPVLFVEYMEAELMEAGIEPSHIHFEVFTPLIPV